MNYKYFLALARRGFFPYLIKILNKEKFYDNVVIKGATETVLSRRQKIKLMVFLFLKTREKDSADCLGIKIYKIKTPFKRP